MGAFLLSQKPGFPQFRANRGSSLRRSFGTASQVNKYTMESLKVKGLYFAGEVLDIDANTGGYNLQIAFSTGRLAGQLKK